MKPIKLFDLYSENKLIESAFFKDLKKLYADSDFTLGFKDGPVESLEAIFQEKTGRHSLGFSSGTSALHAASFGLNLKKGDEVIVPANTFIATATAPAFCGAKVVVCDVDKDTLNISAETITKAITKRTKAIFAVNLYGNPVDYDELKKFNISIIEDAAHSHGAIYKNRPSGSFGEMSAFSFFPNKVFGGIGDGGLLTFKNKKLTPQLKSFRNAGQSKSHWGENLGNVYRLSTINALFLSHKWKNFKKVLNRRREIAKMYDEAFKGIEEIQTQKITPNSKSSYFCYVIRIKNRSSKQTKLMDIGIPTTVQYRYLINEQPVYSEICAKVLATPNALKAKKEICSLPIHYGMTNDQVEFICSNVIKICKKNLK
jgi:dTDP-4-amino-4,6-dideoxygalactose transaminase